MSRLTEYDPCGARSRPSGRFTCDRRPHPGDGPHQALVPDYRPGTFRVLTWDEDPADDVTVSPTLLVAPVVPHSRHRTPCQFCGRRCDCTCTDSKATKAAARELLADCARFCRVCGRALPDGFAGSDALCAEHAEHAHPFDAAT